MAAQPGPIASEVELRAQDERIEAIYREHAAGLRGRLIAITRDPAAADDLVGEAFLRLVTQVRDGRIPDDPGAWLHRVAGNLAISRGRRATVATRALPALLDRGLAESPEDEVVRRERNEVVRDALSTLDRDDQELVAMAAIGHRPVDIAGKTGRSNQATRTRLCRARGRLRARLIATGLMAWSGTPPLPTAAGVTPAASPCLSSPDVDEGRGERLIARSGELQRLTMAWDRAVAGRSGAVIVAGEAGIGKSRLVRAFAEGIGATGARVLGGGCVPLETGDLPYGPFVEALRSGRGERLIARSGELQRLTMAWDRAVAGRSGAVIVAGEAGIGKSRLVRAFAEGIGATGARVLGGGCVPLETGDLPYGPFVEAL